jgi:SAM-dependent methyltransferase
MIMDTQQAPDGGWNDSAGAWAAVVDRGDPNRELLLDPVMLDLAGDVLGLRVLDLGCGEGRFGRLLAERGAARVVGLDVASALVGLAAERRSDVESYVLGSGEALPCVEGAFDLVVSYLSLLDIPDFRAAIAEIARVLRPGGRLLAANMGFVTASELGWARDDQGRRLYQRIDRYADEWSYVAEWAGIRIINWHRPLSAYMQAYLGAGLILRAFLEPVPADQSLREQDYFEDWFRVPLFNVMLWQKPE